MLKNLVKEVYTSDDALTATKAIIMDRAVLLLSALLVNAAFAGPRSLYAPLRLERIAHMPAVFIGKAQRKLDREHRSLRDREARGAVFVLVLFAVCVLMGWLLAWVFSFNLQFLEIGVLAVLLPVRPTWSRVKALHGHVKRGDLMAARQTLDNTPWRHSALLDPFGMSRAGIEFLGVQFTAKIFSPALWFCLCGLPGFLFIRGLYLLVETLNLAEGGARGFGRMAMQVHRVLDYIPSRLACVLWLWTSYFLSGAEPKVAARAIWHDAAYTKDSQSFTLMSVAHVLGLSLGGPMSAYGDKHWWGSGTVKAQAADVARALYLFALLHLFLFIGFGLFF